MTDKKDFIQSVFLVREFSKKRKFNQTVDIVITLKDLNFKKPEENIDTFVTLPHTRGKQPKICAFVGPDLADKAKVFDKVVVQKEFAKFEDQKLANQLASGYDVFIAQANLMGQIATYFGKILGPRGKMPNPKGGAVVPPTANLEALKVKFSKTVRLQTKKELNVQAPVGREDMKDEDIADNAMAVYNAMITALPQDTANIKEVYVKFTMGPSIKLGQSKEDIQKKLEEKAKPKKQPKTAKPKAAKKAIKKKAKEKVKEDAAV